MRTFFFYIETTVVMLTLDGEEKMLSHHQQLISSETCTYVTPFIFIAGRIQHVLPSLLVDSRRIDVHEKSALSDHFEGKKNTTKIYIRTNRCA